MSPFHAEIAYGLEGRAGLRDLSEFDAVALCGADSTWRTAARSLDGFVAGGGGLITILDAGWHPGATAALAESGLFPPIAGAAGGGSLRPVAEWDRAHPALAAFDGQGGGDLRDLAWRDGFAFKAGTAGGRSPRWMASRPAFGTGARAAIRRVCAAMVLAHPLTRDWGDLPREPLFVPLVKNLFAYLTRYEPGAPQVLPRTPGAAESRAPGIYGGEAGTEVVAASVSESDLTPAAEADFRAAFALPAADAAPAPVRLGRMRWRYRDLPADAGRSASSGRGSSSPSFSS
ncbi:MAG: hypothetical protein R3F11_02895 [Verrucomicrobiales bacterium]